MQLRNFFNLQTLFSGQIAETKNTQNIQLHKHENLQNPASKNPIFYSRNWNDMGFQFEEFANEYAEDCFL